MTDEFWSRADVGDEESCWLWQGPTTHNGYGRHHRGKLDVRAHRYAYELTYGTIPRGMQIDHTCHTRMCVNPAHLQAVTPQQNSENLSGAHRDSKTGVRGVYECKRSGRYVAEVYSGGKSYWIGAFRDLGAAAAAVSAARRRLMTNNLVDRAS